MGVSLSVIVCWLSLRVANKFSVPPINLLTFALKPSKLRGPLQLYNSLVPTKQGSWPLSGYDKFYLRNFQPLCLTVSVCTLPRHVFTWGRTEPRSCTFEEEFDGWSPPHIGEPAQTFAHQTWKEASKAEKREWYNTGSCYSFVSFLRGNHAYF